MRLKYNDKMHAYWLDGQRCKNISSVASIAEDKFRLNAWSQRQVAIGIATKPSLIEQIAANVDNDSKLNELCEQAAAEAGAFTGRDRGNVLHKALEQHDAGKRFIPTDLTSTAIRAWEDILELMGWEVVFIERCVIWPDEKIAGRFDRIVKDKRGVHYIVDFKGGAKVLNYPHPIACQLALYANAPYMTGPIPEEGGETEDVVMLNVDYPIDCGVGYVVHLPPDADAQLIELDIAAGMETVRNVIFPTLEWRARKGLAKVIDLDIAPMATKDIGDFEEADVVPVGFTPLLDARQDNLKQRLTWLKDHKPNLAQILAGRWPEGVPSIKSNIPLTGEDMDRIEEVLAPFEREGEAPFDPPLAALEEVADKSAPPSPPRRTPDEGPDMDADTMAAFKMNLERLEPELFDRINAWVAEANTAHVDISMRSKPSKRRFSIGRAFLLAVHHHEDVVRAVLSLVLADEIQPSVTTGSVFGVLTQPEAERAWEVFLALDAGEWHYDTTLGRLVAA